MIPSEEFTDVTLASEDTIDHDDHYDHDDHDDHDNHDESVWWGYWCVFLASQDALEVMLVSDWLTH